MHEIRPQELQLGNFFDSMGKVQMVRGIVQQAEDSWFVEHHGWERKSNPIPDGVQYTPFALELTEAWKVCLGIDKYEGMPSHIKYVHQAQNWFMWHLQVNLLETMNWDLLPTKI